MKTIVQISKTSLLCILLFAARSSFAQLLPTTFTTTQGQCVDLGVDTFSGITIDTFSILSGPFNGQLVPGVRPGSWLYCPDSTFTGTDQADVYVCISGPLFPICDTVQLVFNVTSNCNLTGTIFVDQNGCLIPNFSGGNPPYTYVWSNGDSTFTICNATAGTYCVTFTDVSGCTASTCSTVGGCNLTATIVTTNSLICSGESTAITAIGGNGNPPYSYFWSTGATTATITVSPSSITTYMVTVTDNNVCAATTSTIITVAPNPTATISQSLDSVNCPGGTRITASATGGTPPYIYTWTNGAASQSTCAILSGTYCLTLYDGNGCTAHACATIGSCNLSIVIQPGPCAGPLPSLQAVVAGGTPPYQYLWSNAASSDVICNLTAGVYCLTVIDANNCSVSSCQNVTGGCQLTAAVLEDSVICGGRTGLSVIPALGTSPYSYVWSDFSTTQTICPTTAGTYCATVTDASGCATAHCYQFGSGCQLSVAVVLDSSGCLQTLTSGGTPPYSYQWSDGTIGIARCNINPLLTYTVVVTDSTGCSGTATYGSGGCQLFSTITQSGSCLAVTSTGGTPPYNYTWSDGSNTPTICPNLPGTYCVTITDSQGCQDFQCGTVGGGCQITTIIVDDTITRCYNAITTGGIPPYTYLWSDGIQQASHCSTVFTTVACVTVTDVNGCQAAACCEVQVTIVLDSSGCLNAIASGGSGQYGFEWSDGTFSSSSICPQFPGVYCVTVMSGHSGNCFGTACYNYQPSGTCSFTYTQSAPFSPYIVVFATSYDSVLNPASVNWDLGDGNTGTGFQFTHIYDTCDVVYNVTMTLIDSIGNTLCSYNQPIYVSCFPDSNNRYCQAYFYSYQAPDSNGTVASLTFNFADQSVYNPVSFAWDFGDGSFSTLQNPSHTYSTAGIYNVCLITTDGTGCSSTYCQQVNAGNVPVQDLSAYIYHYTTVTPGFPLWVDLSYCNFGTILMNGTVEYRYPVGTTFVSATPPPASHDVTQRLLTFDFSNLLPGTCGYIAVDLTADASLPIGSTANDMMWVLPVAGDVNPADNVSTLSDVVIGSWDPNDKAVSPKGLDDAGEIPVSTPTLSYKIRFQNTGTAFAQNIVIRDAMDNSIDLASVRVADASHEHITQIIGNELVVTFNNIMLPDSNANEPASHGYIQIVADLKPGLPEGTQVFNTAEIYFDLNPAVITNTVVNTLKDEGTGIKQSVELDFSIMPNPAQDEIVISGKFSRNSTYEIVNELGQMVLNGDAVSDRIEISIRKLNAGIYFVRIKSRDKTGVQRLAVSK